MFDAVMAFEAKILFLSTKVFRLEIEVTFSVVILALGVTTEFRLEIEVTFRLVAKILVVWSELEAYMLPMTWSLAAGLVVPNPIVLLVDIKTFAVETAPPAPSKTTKLPCVPDGAEPEGPWGPVGPGGPWGPRKIIF